MIRHDSATYCNTRTVPVWNTCESWIAVTEVPTSWQLVLIAKQQNKLEDTLCLSSDVYQEKKTLKVKNFCKFQREND